MSFEVKELGQVIAVRNLVFVYDNDMSETTTVKVGLPYASDEPNAFICPYEISSESHSKLFGMVGIDAIQALDLTMKILKTELDYWERKYSGKFRFLDEVGHGCENNG